MKTLFTFLFILLGNLVIAQDVLVIKNSKEITNISKQVSSLEDKENNLSIKDILKSKIQSKFVPNVDKNYIYPNQVSPLWIKFSLQNTSGKELFLHIEAIFTPNFEIYIPTNIQDSFRVKQFGSSLPYFSREVITNFHLVSLVEAQDSAVNTFYIHFSNKSSARIPLKISEAKSFFKKNHERDLFYGVFLGIISIMALYNFFIYLVVKDTTYLFYVCHIIMSGLTTLTFTGYGFNLFWYNYPQMNEFILPFMISTPLIFLILFSISFLNTAKYAPRAQKGLYGFIAVFIVNITYSVITQTSGMDINQLFALILCVYLLSLAVYVYRKGNKAVRFYMLANGFYLLGIMFTSLMGLGVLPSNAFTNYAHIIGTILEVLFFSFALADRIKVLTKDKEEAQKENLRLVEEQKDTLEAKVKEKTIELEQKNQEIETQNEELFQQKKEIVSLNTNLESLVSQRTEELRQTLDNLTKQNQDLSQFSYIISHNLRAPVARILGLVNIFNEKNYNDDFNKEIVNHLKNTTIDLDTVIKDLTQIISIRNDLNKTKEETNILESIERKKNLLQDEIKTSNAVINTELVSIKSILTIKSYFQSILYNLISNAIKYKSDKRSPIIKIKTEMVNDFVCFSVQDNGLGIDLSKTDTYKIFGLYQRMHNHVDGKGLGLFLVKTQIESLGGKIEIESQLDVGTTFKVYFPNVV